MSRSVAVITGASSGLGEAFALAVAAHPAFAQVREIWLVARREERLEALARRLPGGRGVVVRADLASEDGVARVLARARECEAQVQLLVNNAGFGWLGPMLEQTPEELGRLLDLNVRAGTLLLHGLGPQMPRGAGVLQVASAAAYVPAPYFAAYAASKSYALALALALREEWRARGVAVCAVCPGPVATEFLALARGPRATGMEAGGVPAARVVALALRDLLAGRAGSHAGIGAGALSRLAGVMPRSLLVRAAGRRNLRRTGRAPTTAMDPGEGQDAV